MKDLGFDEDGDLASSKLDEESQPAMEMHTLNHEVTQLNEEDPEGSEEADHTEIAL